MRRTLVFVAAVSSALLFMAGAAVADNYASGNKHFAKHARLAHGLGFKQQSASHGDYSLLFDFSTGMPVPVQTTDLVDCSALQQGVVLQIRGTFDFYDGICDDFDGPQCGNKLIYVAEYCQGVKAFDVAGRIRSDFGRHAVRICYDPNETGRCTSFNEIARGFLTAQDQALIIDEDVPGAIRQIGVRTITKSRPFRFDGKRVRIARVGSFMNVIADVPPFPFLPPDFTAPPVPGRCNGLNIPCGFAATGVGIGR